MRRARGALLAKSYQLTLSQFAGSYPLTLSLPAGSYLLIAFAARRFC
ncbi:MAG TPA: hypothetical protein VEY11_02080 [Pyrinomonadaceae bacterium]|nr:hypothetical protein [Pyrinomonadaceae bacterium]